ncbi:SDR family oxidoreductase [Amycolatopsis minnesotensis]|uniref:SDR family oxidoreductase n=1 Tax=Amycolatopsis minnesotensis TaxID=337894 RepID=A0ABN2QFR3_9PSEU
MADRVVLVTGGARGIGAALARHHAAKGATVVIADIDESGAAVADETGGVFVDADVSTADGTGAAVRTAEELGGIAVLHLNAGIPGGTSFGDGFDVDRYRRGIGVNLDAVVFGIQAALPGMRARGGGAILVTASIAGLTLSGDVFYAAAKHAAIGLVRSCAAMLEDSPITVNALCPGFVRTPMLEPFSPRLEEAGVLVAEPALVGEAADAVLAGGRTGEAWPVQAGQPFEPWSFGEIVLSRSS